MAEDCVPALASQQLKKEMLLVDVVAEVPLQQTLELQDIELAEASLQHL